jgi:hypothetical protein
VLVRLGLVLADIMGTLVMCGLIITGAFVWLHPGVGFIVAGLMVPVVEFKVSWSAKRRAAERAAER